MENKVYEITSEEDFFKYYKSNKIIVVDFNADWCYPCQKIKPDFHKLPQQYPNYVFLSVNADNCPEISEEFVIQYLPTFLIFKDQEELNRIEGANFEAVLEALLELD